MLQTFFCQAFNGQLLGSESTINLTTTDLASIAFGIIGIVGTIYTILSWKASKKDKKINNYLFSLAEKNLDKDITDEQLKRKREEIGKYSERILFLQEKIEKEIPQQARVAVLKDKLHSQNEQLVITYNSITAIKQELNGLESESQIPEEVQSAIEKEINPEYLEKERRSNLKNYLTIITTTAAILSALLPYPYNKWISVPLSVIALPVVYQLFKSSWPKDSLQRKILRLKVIAFFCSALGVIGIFLSSFFFYFVIIDSYDSEFELALAVGSFGVSLISGLIGFTFYRKQAKAKETS